MARVGFHPDHDEAARQAFIGSLKAYANGPVEGKLGTLWQDQLLPQHAATGAAPPASRAEAAALLEPHPLYRLWATLTFHSQNLMWDAVQRTTDRTIDQQVAACRAAATRPDRLGSMTLADRLLVKAPIATTEIHRQPGGYWRERRADDVEAALNYAGTVDLYRNAKGMGTGGAQGSDSIGQLVAAEARRRAPDLAPTRVLDMGCGTGEQTLAYRRCWPAADVHGIDVARPFIRYAHGFAQTRGVALHLHEMDAAATDFPDAHFDLITSIILFHETSRAAVDAIFRECWRLVRPGGLVLHLDVPYQPHRTPLVAQVTNHWQVRHNGEPFWTGFAELDIRAMLLDAGFDPAGVIADHVSVGPATFFFFGGRKPLAASAE